MRANRPLIPMRFSVDENPHIPNTISFLLNMNCQIAKSFRNNMTRHENHTTCGIRIVRSSVQSRKSNKKQLFIIIIEACVCVCFSIVNEKWCAPYLSILLARDICLSIIKPNDNSHLVCAAVNFLHGFMVFAIRIHKHHHLFPHFLLLVFCYLRRILCTTERHEQNARKDSRAPQWLRLFILLFFSFLFSHF